MRLLVQSQLIGSQDNNLEFCGATKARLHGENHSHNKIIKNSVSELCSTVVLYMRPNSKQATRVLNNKILFVE